MRQLFRANSNSQKPKPECLRSMRFILAILAMAFVPNQAYSQIIRLPTVRNFSVNTSVLVPDRGSSFLGGNAYGGYGSSSYSGLTPNRAFSGGVGNSFVSTHVTITDLDELDRAILAAANRSAFSATPSEDRVPSDVMENMLKKQQDALAGNYSPPVRYNETPRQQFHQRYRTYGYATQPASVPMSRYESTEEDLKFYLLKAQQAKTAGRWAAAQVFYEQAWNLISDERKSEYLAAIRKSDAPSKSTPRLPPGFGKY